MSKRDQQGFPFDPVVRSLRRRAAWLGAAGLAAPGLALAAPTGGDVVAGEAAIDTPAADTTTITQSSQAAIINWQTFSIDGQEFVIFNQPSVSSVALNRVVGGAPSEIFGTLLANGRVFLVNPSGLLFAPGAQLDVGGLVATTMSISDEDFMAGRYVFTSGGDGAVVNEGRITAADGGFIVLGADYVRNSGIVQARLGEVALASGRAMTLDLDGEDLVDFTIDEATMAELAGVDNLGEIGADGGTVYMSAAVARGLLGTVVNNQGRVRAQTIEQGADGAIYLSAEGGGIVQGGTLDAAGGELRLDASGNIELADDSQTRAAGGEIRAVADGRLHARREAVIDASTDTGGGFVELSGQAGLSVHGTPRIGRGGSLLIDPETLTVGAQGTDPRCLYDTCYELLEGVLMQGGDVQLVASSQISLLATAAGSFDGRTAEGFGGGLLIGIGYVDGGYYRGTTGDIVFDGPASDLFAVDSHIAIYAGSEGGGVSGMVELSVGGDIDVDALGDISGNRLQAGGSIEIYSGGALSLGQVSSGSGVVLSGYGGLGYDRIDAAGEVKLDAAGGALSGGDISAGGPIHLYAGDGDIRAGLLSTMASVGTPGGNLFEAAAADVGDADGSVSLYATGDIQADGIAASANTGNGYANVNVNVNVNVNAEGAVALGDIDAAAEGGVLLSIGAGGGDLATGGLRLTAGGGDAIAYAEASGDVLIDGAIDIDAGGADTGLPANALLAAQGQTVTIGGDSRLSGVGEAGVQILAHSGIHTGALELHSAAASDAFDDGDSTYFERWSDAYATLYTETGAVGTGALAVDGLEAVATIIGDAVSIGGDLSLTAPPAGAANGYYLLETLGGETLVESTASGAGAYIVAQAGSLTIDGAVQLKGPTAGATLLASDAIDIAGGIGIEASGYTVAGDAARLFGEDGFAGSPVSPLLLPPLIDQGELAWGGAGLLIGGPALENGSAEASDFAGAAHIGGDVMLSGQGAVIAQMFAGELQVEGAITTLATLGLIEGRWQETRIIDGSTYALTRNVSGRDGGPARYAQSGIYLGLSAGDGDTGDLRASGGDASVQLEGGNAWSIGEVEVAGGRGAQSNDYADTTQFEPIDGSDEPIGETQTLLVGGLSSFGVGDGGEVPAQFQAGDIGVSGRGQAALAIVAGEASTGALRVDAESGLLLTDDPTVLAETAERTIGDASLRIETEGALQAASLAASAAQNLHLGGNLQLAGDAGFTAGGAIDQVQPASQAATAPLSGGAAVQSSTLGAAPPRSDLMLPGLRVEAGGAASLDFAQDSHLQALQLTAASIAVDGPGAHLAIDGDATLAASAGLSLGTSLLSAASAALSGNALALSEARISTGNLTLHQFSGDLTVGDFSGERLSLRADAGGIQAGDLSVDTLSASAAGNLLLSDLSVATSLLLEAGDTAGTRIEIGDIAYAGPLAFEYENTDVQLGRVDATGLSIHLAHGDARFGNVETGLLDVSAANIDGHGSSIGADSVALTAGARLDLSTARLAANQASLDGASLALGEAAIDAPELSLRQRSGDLAFGDFEGVALSLRADAGDISAGDLNASALDIDAAGSLTLVDLVAGEALSLRSGDTVDTQVQIGSIDYAGALAFAYENAELSLGDVEVGRLDIDLGSGELTLGRVTAAQIQVTASTLALAGTTLDADELSLATRGALSLDAVTARADDMSVLAGGTLSVQGSPLDAGTLDLRADGGDLSLIGSQLNSGTMRLIASGDVRAAGTGSTIGAQGLGVQAGGLIDLAAADVQLGSGSAPLSGDPGLIDLLPQDLRPASAQPNAVFRAAGGVHFGGLSLSGDHLHVAADIVSFAEPVDAPAELFVQFSPFSDGAALGIENAGGTRTINFTVAGHVAVFPGTTIAFGSSSYAGDIFVGSAGALDVAGRDTNFVFLTSGDISGTTRQLPTNGQVVVLGGTIVDTADGAVPPDPEGDTLPGESGLLIGVFDDDDDDDLIDETSGGDDAECE